MTIEDFHYRDGVRYEFFIVLHNSTYHIKLNLTIVYQPEGNLG